MKILISDDDPVTRRLLETTLAEWGHQIVVTHDGNQALQALQEEDPPTLAILDWIMPEMDGIEVCRRVRQWGDVPYIYIIMLTVKDSQQDMIEGLEAGADDYITKPVDIQELRVRLRAGQRVLDLQDAFLTTQKILQNRATQDALTELWNRFKILQILENELNRSSREGVPVAILMADLDNFKQVNDTFGHVAGDAVLREVAQRMHSCLRSYDSIGRYGGEEFLIVLPGCDAWRCLKVAERLRSCVCEQSISTDKASVSLTVSLGGATSDAFLGVDAATLIRMADAALYRAKAKGKNCFEMVTDSYEITGS
jgi:diguanylate cyclase (GGDEF)-like protein